MSEERPVLCDELPLLDWPPLHPRDDGEHARDGARCKMPEPCHEPPEVGGAELVRRDVPESRHDVEPEPVAVELDGACAPPLRRVAVPYARLEVGEVVGREHGDGGGGGGTPPPGRSRFAARGARRLRPSWSWR